MYGFGNEQETAFQKDLKAFADKSGFTIKFTKAGSWDTEIKTRVAGGNPPDVGLFPQPGVMCDLAKQGKVLAYDDATVTSAKATLVNGFVGAGTCTDGKVYGLPSAVSVKSLLWYDAPVFAAAGYKAPTTLAAVSYTHLDVYKRQAYAGGRGTFRTRATARIENITPRRRGIVVTELPYLVGPEKVIEKIRDQVQSKRLLGISDVKDLTDRSNGLQLVIEVKSGFVPEAVLEELYRLTPMEDSFGINNVALVEGQPRTLGLVELLSVFVDFRIGVVRRRTAHRLAKREERLHLVDGLVVAILNIDEVIQLIRAADDTATARARLMGVFDLSEAQATYILELQLRRLTKFSRLELELSLIHI